MKIYQPLIGECDLNVRVVDESKNELLVESDGYVFQGGVGSSIYRHDVFWYKQKWIKKPPIRLYIFDKDGTLIPMVGNRPANKPREQVLLPGRLHKIQSLRGIIAVASNQGGVSLGYISMGDAYALMEDIKYKIGAHTYRFCPHYKEECDCRKPKPGMILNIMQEFGVEAVETLYVGDLESDYQTARNAGVRFAWSDEFFGDSL